MTATEHAEAILNALGFEGEIELRLHTLCLPQVEAAMQDARAGAIAECAEVAGKVAYQCRQRENGHGYYDARLIHSEIRALIHVPREDVQ